MAFASAPLSHLNMNVMRRIRSQGSTAWVSPVLRSYQPIGVPLLARTYNRS